MSWYPETHEEAERLKKQAKRDRKIGTMHKLYGKHGSEICGHCVYLMAKELANTYFKCRLFGNTCGPGTDWLKRFEACGKFKERG